MKNIEREKARKLRRDDGLPINEIATLLNVAKSSVSMWVRDIELSKEQHAMLRLKNPIYNRQLTGNIIKKKKYGLLRENYRKEGVVKALENNILYAMGCMLYWGEGDKCSRYSVGLSNSDPHLLKLFKKFLKECYGVLDTNIVLRIFCYSDDPEKIRAIEEYWVDQLSLSRDNLRKTVVNCVSRYSKRKRTNTLEFGTCHLGVHSVKLKQSIVGAIQEYGKFINESWH
jgi:hypothetical protein